METLRIEKEKTLMIAHRGLSGLERENTVTSFIAAGNRSYYGMETDIHLTKDNVFVICHDFHTGRVSPIKVNIKDCTYRELLDINLYKFESKETASFLKIPTLKEYIEICKKYEKHCIIELKPEFTKKELEVLLQEITNMNYLENIIFISFNLDNLKRIRRLNKTIPLQYLISEYSSDLVTICKKDHLDIDIHYQALSKQAMDAFHSAKIKVNAWTVNNPIEALILVSWGIDFITTNILE